MYFAELVLASALFHGPVHIPLGVPHRRGLPFVMELFALAEPQLHLYQAVLEIDGQWDQRGAVLLDLGLELPDLPLVHQQAAGAHRVTVEDVPVLVRADVHPPEDELPIFHGAEGVFEVELSGADGLDLRACQLDAGFKAVQDEIVVEGFAVGGHLLDALGFRGHGLPPWRMVLPGGQDFHCQYNTIVKEKKEESVNEFLQKAKAPPKWPRKRGCGYFGGAGK